MLLSIRTPNHLGLPSAFCETGICKRFWWSKTDLVLNADNPNYDAAAVDSLADAVAAYMAAHDHIDSADITPL